MNTSRWYSLIGLVAMGVVLTTFTAGCEACGCGSGCPKKVTTCEQKVSAAPVCPKVEAAPKCHKTCALPACPKCPKVEKAPKCPKVEKAPCCPKVEAAPKCPKVEAAPTCQRVQAAPACVSVGGGTYYSSGTYYQGLGSPNRDLVQVAGDTANLTIFASLVKEAGLDDTLRSAGPFTVFAPTDDAFRRLPAGTLDNLRKRENRDQLVSILKYHIIAGRQTSGDVMNMSTARSLQGDTLNLSTTGGLITINSARVLQPDIQASNGVIHEIDSVLMPGLGAAPGMIRQGQQFQQGLQGSGAGYERGGNVNVNVDTGAREPARQTGGY